MMIGKLSILDRDKEEVCAHKFNMAGSDQDRLVSYAVKTLRRRWTRVEWFGSMQVWASPSGNPDFDYVLVAELTIDNENPVVIIDRR